MLIKGVLLILIDAFAPDWIDRRRNDLSCKTHFLAIAFASTIASGPAAAEVIDLSSLFPFCCDIGSSGGLEWQQALTAGSTGQLTAIDLAVGPGTFNLRIGIGNAFFTGPWVFDQEITLDFAQTNPYAHISLLQHFPPNLNRGE